MAVSGCVLEASSRFPLICHCSSCPFVLTPLLAIGSMPLTYASFRLTMRLSPRLTAQGGYRETTTCSVSAPVCAVRGYAGHRLGCDHGGLCRTDSQARHVHGRRPGQTGPSLSTGSATSINYMSPPRTSNRSSSRMTLRRVKCGREPLGQSGCDGGGDANGRV
jgi:hypothetical protein